METAGPGAGGSGGGGGGPTRHERRCGRRLDAACVVRSAPLHQPGSVREWTNEMARWAFVYLCDFIWAKEGTPQFYRYTAPPVAPTAAYLPFRHQPLPLSLPLASRSPSPSQSCTRAAPGRRAVGAAACLCSHRHFPHPRPHGAGTSLGSHLDVSSVLLLPKFALRLCLRCCRDQFLGYCRREAILILPLKNANHCWSQS